MTENFEKYLKLFKSDFQNHKKEINRNNFNFFKKILIEMQEIRNIELLLARKKKNGYIKGPIHLAVGQEAGPVVISKYLKKGDLIFGNHRSHAHILSLKCNTLKFLSEITGRKYGLSKGLGGSMHLRDIRKGFAGSVPIVAGTIAISAGAALALKKRKKKNISVAYFGDSAVEEGVFHETLNFAQIKNLPILFVLENNSMASHLHISERQHSPVISRFANANKIKFKIVDGNNVISINENIDDLISYMRKYSKPAFIELVTFRWFGHVDWREDIDVGVDRKRSDVIKWKKKDPIKRLDKILQKNRVIDAKFLINYSNKHKKKINKLWEKSIKKKFPSKKILDEINV